MAIQNKCIPDGTLYRIALLHFCKRKAACRDVPTFLEQHSYMSSLKKCAYEMQKWPFVNLKVGLYRYGSFTLHGVILNLISVTLERKN